MKRFFHIHQWWEIAIIFFLSLTPLFWFRGNEMLLGHDSGVRLDYMAQLPNLFYSWDPKVNFGVDWSMFKGFLVTQFPETIFSYLTHSLAWGEKITFVFWFGMMGMGMYVFLKRIFSEKEYVFLRLFSSVFYMYNFFILNAWSIGERAKFSLYAALPLGLLLMYNMFIRNTSMVRNGILFGVLYFFLNGGGVLPLYGGTIIVFGVAWIVFTWYRVRLRGWKELLFSGKALLACIVPFLLFNAYYIVPHISLLRTSFTSSLGNQGGIEGLIAWERVISKSASFFNLLRLQGMPDWYDNPAHPYAKLYLTNTFFIILSFIPSVVIFLGLVFDRFKTAAKEKQIVLWFLMLLLPFGLFFTMGTHPPTGILYEFAMKKIPGFVMFRSSFYKFAPALWFPMIVLSGYFIQRLLQHIRYVNIRNFLGGVCIIGVLLYHFSYFTTDAFVINTSFQTRIALPTYLQNITSDLKSTLGEHESTLVLPRLDNEYIHLPIDTYTWGFFSLDILPRSAAQRRFIANDSTNTLVTGLYDALYSGDVETARRLMSLLRISHILWRGDVKLTDKTLEMYPIAPLKKMLDSDEHFSKVSPIGLWTVYQLKDTPLEDQIYTASNVNVVTGSEKVYPYLMAHTNDSFRSPLVTGMEKEIGSSMTVSAYKEATCVMCDKHEYEALIASISIPNQRLQPNSLLFFIQKQKDTAMLKNTASDPRKRIDVDIALMQNALSYAIRLSDSSYLSFYQAYMDDAVSQWKKLEGEDRNTYAIRLSAYIEAHKKNVSSEYAAALEHTWDTVSEVLKKEIWMSVSDTYRYVIHIDQDGMYTVLSDVKKENVGQVFVDESPLLLDKELWFREGLHRIAVSVIPGTVVKKPSVLVEKNISKPTLSDVIIRYKVTDPTKYTVHIDNPKGSTFFLVFKEQFDTRWDISEKNTHHVLVDGFSNGWIMDRKGSYDVTISYLPQYYFYIGLGISMVSLVVALGYFFLGRKK